MSFTQRRASTVSGPRKQNFKIGIHPEIEEKPKPKLVPKQIIKIINDLLDTSPDMKPKEVFLSINKRWERIQ